MRDRRARRIRNFLALLMPLGCVLLVCDLQGTCDPEVNRCGPLSGAQGYELLVHCVDAGPPDVVTLSAGDGQTPYRGCLQAEASDSATSGNGPIRGSSRAATPANSSAAISHRAGRPRRSAARGRSPTASTGTRSASTPATQAKTLRIGMRALPLGPEPPGTLDATAIAECPGFMPVELPPTARASPSTICCRRARTNTGNCTIHVTLDSSVAAEGDSLHSVTFFVSANPRTCVTSDDCSAGLRCGPDGCQLGTAGDPCASPYVPVDPDLDLPPLGDCEEDAPICASYARCTAGDVDDGCRADTDCDAGLHCTSPIFGRCAP